MALNTQSGVNGVNHLTPTSSNGNTTPKSPGVRPMLPNRSVTSGTIEDAYVSFILHCNPAVPLDVDTAALREAFRTPPKSEGKSFSTFTLFELIAKLHQKEIKTWAELALRLGVEPPDHEKGQSSQKIQQYAVRLKRWMHSMHVNAFFDYLLDNPHPYWTQIPTDNNPVCEDGRDGVAAEDDMALRALLPQIRPRRGRKRPDEDGITKSPAQRPRYDSPAFNNDGTPSHPEPLNSWTPHQDSRQSFGYPPADPRSSILPGHDSAYQWPHELPREMMTNYPHSAITPNTRSAFWPESGEPQSAVSPKSKPLGRRHGAKAVSSAWRSIGVSTSGKARGRPPMNRNAETPLSAYPSDRSVSGPPPQSAVFDNAQHSNQHSNTSTPAPAPPHMPPPDHESATRTPEPGSAQSSRQSRPARLSLQVPERSSGPVRLATPPPPALMVNGRNTINDNESPAIKNKTLPPADIGGYTIFDRTSAMYLNPENPSRIDKIDIDGTDKTNHDEVESVFVVTLTSCTWYDPGGVPGPRPTIAEIVALVRAVIRSIADQALTKEAFLINLAALVGGHFMIKPGREVHRLEIGSDYTKYLCKWDLHYGATHGTFTLTETVPHSKWKPGHQVPGEPLEKDQMPTDGIPAAEYWQAQYASLAVTSIRRLDDLTVAKTDALRLLKGTADVDPHRPC
ncbi:ARS binding protein 2-domain-containing protein [Astrocystis sublimbata]|nr:ARS binding protein 2-domain-containing protein [Astrocystis sublimbata]